MPAGTAAVSGGCQGSPGTTYFSRRIPPASRQVALQLTPVPCWSQDECSATPGINHNCNRNPLWPLAQLIAARPSVRTWSADSSAVALAQIHRTAAGRVALTAQQNVLEVRGPPPADASFQLFGHNGRVSCATLLDLGADRLGVVSGSADQTLRCVVCGAGGLARAPEQEGSKVAGSPAVVIY